MREPISTEENAALRRVNRIAGDIITLCDTALVDIITTLEVDWKGDAAKLYINRLSGLKEELSVKSGVLRERASGKEF